MNTPNPLIPQGSLESQQYNKRSMTKIVVSTILAVHGVVLGGLLFLGCKEDPEKTGTQYANNGLEQQQTAAPDLPPLDETDPFGDLLRTNGPIVIPSNPGSTFPGGNSTTPPPFPPGFGGQTATNDDPFEGLIPKDPATTGGGVVAPLNERQTVIEPPGQPDTSGTMGGYVVVTGDTYTSIARKHGIKISDIAAANPGVNPRNLKIGQQLNLPPNIKAQTPTVPATGSPRQLSNEVTYVVKSGDTLLRISRNYGVSIKAIQDANGIRGSLIKVGQELKIPTGSN